LNFSKIDTIDFQEIYFLWGLIWIQIVCKCHKWSSKCTASRLRVKNLTLTLSAPNKLSSAKIIVCFNFQSALMSLKVGKNVVRVSNSLYLDETPSYSASHPDSSCLHMAHWLCLVGHGLKVILLLLYKIFTEHF